jgi:DNA polymerase-3 subunit epsilon
MKYPIKTKVPNSEEYKTLNQWEKEGYTPKARTKPTKMWTNVWCQISCEYYRQNQVRPMTEQEKERLAERIRSKRAEVRRFRKEAKATALITGKPNQYCDECELMDEAIMRKMVIEEAVKRSEITYEPQDEIILDVETTGLNSIFNEVLQVSIINSNGETLYNSYLKPLYQTRWDEAESVNGITPEMVENAPTIIEEMPQIAAILKSAKRIIGYNTQFDLDFLRSYGCQEYTSDIVDVMRDFAPIYGEYSDYFRDYKWQKLTVCAEYYGFDWHNLSAHNSLADCLATLYCYQEMGRTGYQRLREPYTEEL